jgi:hypothetical protein
VRLSGGRGAVGKKDTNNRHDFSESEDEFRQLIALSNIILKGQRNSMFRAPRNKLGSDLIEAHNSLFTYY